jgi:hypothetical protein
VVVISALAVVAAALVLAWSLVDVASSRMSATTSNEGSLFSTAVIDVALTTSDDDDPDGSIGTRLMVDVENLVPGMVVERCVTVTYRGTLEGVDTRLSGQREAGTGLDRYLDASVELGTGENPECDDFRAERTVYSGTLAQLWSEHPDYPSGLALLDSAGTGDSVSLRVAVTLRSDDAAQGLDTWFWLTVEARA